MKSTSRILLILIVVLAITTALAGAPRLLNYQGRLTDLGGAPLSGTYQMTFKIYDAASGANILWSETQSSVTATDGLFEVLLGSQTPLVSTVFGDTNCWVGLQVGVAPELAPRTRLASSAYSMSTASIDGSSGGTVSSGMTVNGTVYSTSGGFRFPDGSVQSTASSVGGSGAPSYADVFNFFITGGNMTVLAWNTLFTTPAGKSTYLTNISLNGTLNFNCQNAIMFRIANDTVLTLALGIGGTNWTSGGAPLIVGSNETLEILTGTSGCKPGVSITGFQY